MFGFSSQNAFSPSNSPNWGFQTSQPTFGIQPNATPFRTTTSETTGFFPQPASTGFGTNLFTSPPATNTGFTGQASSAPFTFNWSQSGFTGSQNNTLFPTAQQQPQQSLPKRNAFREDFYKAVVRQDKRPLTVHTRITELERSGQIAIQMIQNEQQQYKAIRDEFLKEPWFQRETKISDLNQTFKNEMKEVRQAIKEREIDIDEFDRELRSVNPRSDDIEEAIRDANRYVDELDRLQNPQTREGSMYASTIQNVGEFHVPHKFVEHRCQDLIKRQQRVLYRIEQIEKEEKRDTTSQTSGTVDEFQVFKVLEKLSTTIVRAMNDLEHEVDMKKEMFLAVEYRRHGDLSDPFEEAEAKERARRNEMMYEFKSTRPLVWTRLGDVPTLPSMSCPASFEFQQPGTNFLQPSSGGGFLGNVPQPLLFGQSATTTAINFGTTSQPTNVFGTPQASSGFGSFGGFSTAPATSAPLFGQAGFGTSGTGFGTGFGNTGFGNKNTFPSPGGSSQATTFGANGFGHSPSRFGRNNSSI